MTPPRGALIRVLLGIIDAGRWLVPASRRREWRRQWRADIWHEWIWIRNHPHGITEPATLAARTFGALRHAFHLRLHMRDLEVITHDLRYGWRMMVRKPGFTALAVLTLGLGIGANVTIYSWVESMVRRPLHGVADPDRLVVLNGTTRTRATLSISYPDFVDFRQRKPDSVEDLIAFTMLPMNLRTTGDPIRVVPVWSKETAASTVPLVGRKKVPFTAGYAPMITGAGRPRETATGARIAIGAAWLNSRIERTKRPAAKTHGCFATIEEMAPTIAPWLPSKNDDPIHEAPRIQMMAVRPPFMMLPFTAFSGSARKSTNRRAAAAIITIMIARPISTWPVSVTPSETFS